MLSGWGRWPVVPGHELRSEDLEALTRDANLTRGLGRSYGDASLPSRPTARVAGSRLADRIITFDADTGILHAEAGLTVRDINRTFLPRGWFVPVTPGTSFVTLGGAVASDVHGKNHHSAGTFGRHVRRLRLRAGTGAIVDVSPDAEPDLFDATIGGMGLTGHVLDVEVALRRVPSSWIAGETERVPDLETLIAKLVEASGTWPYTLAWMDALGAGRRGRGVIFRGRWAEPDEVGGRPLTWGRRDPRSRWRRRTGSCRRSACDGSTSSSRCATVAASGGRCCTRRPSSIRSTRCSTGTRPTAPAASRSINACCRTRPASPSTARLFDTIAARGGAPFVVVIKDFGAEGRGRLSFPCPGITFSIDLPVAPGQTQGIVDAVNDIVAAEGGRVYLTKDAFTRAEHYRAMDPRVDAFNAVRRRWDPHGRIRSALSVRLLGDEA